jgi:hypothetical protein
MVSQWARISGDLDDHESESVATLEWCGQHMVAAIPELGSSTVRQYEAPRWGNAGGGGARAKGAAAD